jgi:hypothetical protein
MVISERPSKAMALTDTHSPLVESVLLPNKTEADELIAVAEKSLVKFRSRFMREGSRSRTSSSPTARSFPKSTLASASHRVRRGTS